jgi:hypothetical protein
MLRSEHLRLERLLDSINDSLRIGNRIGDRIGDRSYRSWAVLWNRGQLSRCQDGGDDRDHGLLAVRVTRFFWRLAYIRKQEKTEVQALRRPTLCRFVPLRSVQTGLLSPCPVVPTDS